MAGPAGGQMVPGGAGAAGPGHGYLSGLRHRGHRPCSVGGAAGDAGALRHLSKDPALRTAVCGPPGGGGRPLLCRFDGISKSEGAGAAVLSGHGRGQLRLSHRSAAPAHPLRLLADGRLLLQARLGQRLCHRLDGGAGSGGPGGGCSLLLCPGGQQAPEGGALAAGGRFVHGGPAASGAELYAGTQPLLRPHAFDEVFLRAGVWGGAHAGGRGGECPALKAGLGVCARGVGGAAAAVLREHG